MLRALRTFVGKLLALLERIAVALETSSKQGPTEDAGARTALGRHAEALKVLNERLVKLEAQKEAVDPVRFSRLEASVEGLTTQVRSVRSKVYRTDEYHTPSAKQKADEFTIPGVTILGAGQAPPEVGE